MISQKNNQLLSVSVAIISLALDVNIDQYDLHH